MFWIVNSIWASDPFSELFWVTDNLRTDVLSYWYSKLGIFWALDILSYRHSELRTVLIDGHSELWIFWGMLAYDYSDKHKFWALEILKLDSWGHPGHWSDSPWNRYVIEVNFETYIALTIWMLWLSDTFKVLALKNVKFSKKLNMLSF
jgi:hypothetical protein